MGKIYENISDGNTMNEKNPNKGKTNSQNGENRRKNSEKWKTVVGKNQNNGKNTLFHFPKDPGQKMGPEFPQMWRYWKIAGLTTRNRQW